MKRVLRPSRKMILAGGYSAGSLASLAGSKKVDMASAKEAIRSNRKRRATLMLGKKRIQDELDKRRREKVTNWWQHRRNWVSYRVGSRVGKVKYNDYRSYHGFYVEFPDGTHEWVKNS